MADEEEIGPICIITSNGMVCMESPPKFIRKRDGKTTKVALKKRPSPSHRAAVVAAVAKALGAPDPKKKGPKLVLLSSPAQRRHIGCVAVFLAEAAQLIAENTREELSFTDCWAIVKRP